MDFLFLCAYASGISLLAKQPSKSVSVPCGSIVFGDSANLLPCVFGEEGSLSSADERINYKNKEQFHT